MNVKSFKNLIKEAVSEAVREELQAILIENQKPQASLKESKTINFTSEDINGINDVRTQLRSKMGNMFGFSQPNITPLSNNGIPLVVDTVNENPYMNFIMDAAANMTPQDKSGLSRLD
jgi:hypothetical protein